MDFMKNVIASAQAGHDAAVRLLRKICSQAAEDAPANDLIAIAQYIFHLGEAAHQDDTIRN
jgi:hypothetical protein